MRIPTSRKAPPGAAGGNRSGYTDNISRPHTHGRTQTKSSQWGNSRTDTVIVHKRTYAPAETLNLYKAESESEIQPGSYKDNNGKRELS